MASPMCPAGQMIFSLSVELTQVVQRLSLGTGNEVVVAGHQVQQRAGYLAQIDDVAAQGIRFFVSRFYWKSWKRYFANSR